MRFFTRSTLPILKWGWVPLLPFLVFGNLVAQIEEIPEALLPLDSDNKVVRQQHFLQFISGKSAANYGFSSIAEQIFKELLESDTGADDDDTIIEARYQLILSLLNQDKIERSCRLSRRLRGSEHRTIQVCCNAYRLRGRSKHLRA